MRKLVAVLAISGASLAGPAAGGALADEGPCGDGQVTRAVHRAHVTAERVNEDAGELVHRVECRVVARIDPTRP